MSSVARGTKNAFRNVIRTFSITLILGVSIGLAVVMLLSLKAVQSRIESVKSAIGNTITVSPAGARGFEGGGEPLTESDVQSLKSVSHVRSITMALNDRLRPAEDTSLASAIEPGTLGQRSQTFSQGPPPDTADNRSGTSSTGQRTFTVPVMVTGTNNVASAQIMGGNKPKLTSGKTFATASDENVALVGRTLATKNNLKVGSTFQAYGTTITVIGVFDANDTFSNAGLIMPVKSVQRLSEQAGQVSSATIQIDSVSNLDAAQKAIKTKLGDKADVVTSEDAAKTALDPLQNIKTIAFYSLIGALVAGSVIIFLSMLMIVRERRREIGVLKAIGASNFKIMLQFVTEALVLTTVSGVVGVVLGVLLSNTVLGTLIASSTSNVTGGPRPGGFRAAGFIMRGALSNIQTVVGYDVVLYGFLVALAIAIIGSAIPSWIISRIRPAEVLRGE